MKTNPKQWLINFNIKNAIEAREIVANCKLDLVELRKTANDNTYHKNIHTKA